MLDLAALVSTRRISLQASFCAHEITGMAAAFERLARGELDRWPVLIGPGSEH